MKIRQAIILLFLSLSFLSCKNDKDTSLEKFFSKLSIGVELHPDSVLHVLDSVKPVAQFNEINMARWNLLYTRAIEESTLELPADSIVLCATDVLCLEGSLKEQAYSYFYLGRLHDDKDESDEALEAYLQALDKAKEAKEYRLAGLVGRYIANIYNSMNLYDSAINILKLSGYYLELSDNKRTRTLDIIDIGMNFVFKSMTDSALIYYTEAEHLARKINDQDLLSRIYHQLGTMYNDELADYNSAEYYLKKSIDIGSDKRLTAQEYLALGSVYAKQKRYDKAKSCYLQSLSCIQNGVLDTKAAICWEMKNVECVLGNYKEAIKWSDDFFHLQDSINEIYLKENVAKVEFDYRLRRLLLQNDTLQAVHYKDSWKIVFLLIACFIIVLIYQCCLIRRNKRIKNLSDLEPLVVELKEKVLIGNELMQKVYLLSQIPIRKQKDLKEKIEEIFKSSTISDDDWIELEKLVDEAMDGFVNKLRNKFKGLSEDDIKCVVLLRLGFDNVQLTNVLNIQKDSVLMKRHRIRKRMQVEASLNLDNYIKRLFVK